MSISTRTVFSFLAFPLVSLAAACAPPGVVHAAEHSHKAQSSLKVSFADLDLASRHGTVTLYTRIRNAARTVCGPKDIGLWEDSMDWRRCVDDAIATAVAKVGDANLTAYYVRVNPSYTRVVQR